MCGARRSWTSTASPTRAQRHANFSTRRPSRCSVRFVRVRRRSQRSVRSARGRLRFGDAKLGSTPMRRAAQELFATWRAQRHPRGVIGLVGLVRGCCWQVLAAALTDGGRIAHRWSLETSTWVASPRSNGPESPAGGTPTVPREGTDCRIMMPLFDAQRRRACGSTNLVLSKRGVPTGVPRSLRSERPAPSRRARSRSTSRSARVRTRQWIRNRAVVVGEPQDLLGIVGIESRSRGLQERL